MEGFNDLYGDKIEFFDFRLMFFVQYLVGIFRVGFRGRRKEEVERQIGFDGILRISQYGDRQVG